MVMLSKILILGIIILFTHSIQMVFCDLKHAKNVLLLLNLYLNAMKRYGLRTQEVVEMDPL